MAGNGGGRGNSAGEVGTISFRPAMAIRSLQPRMGQRERVRMHSRASPHSAAPFYLTLYTRYLICFVRAILCILDLDSLQSGKILEQFFSSD